MPEDQAVCPQALPGRLSAWRHTAAVAEAHHRLEAQQVQRQAGLRSPGTGVCRQMSQRRPVHGRGRYAPLHRRQAQQATAAAGQPLLYGLAQGVPAAGPARRCRGSSRPVGRSCITSVGGDQPLATGIQAAKEQRPGWLSGRWLSASRRHELTLSVVEQLSEEAEYTNRGKQNFIET